jgi:site-specific DNA recombinase
MTKAAGYIRVSTSGQAKQDKLSLENQEKKIRKYCQDEFELVEPTFKDVISGAKDDRPGLQALLAAARRKEFEHVIVNDLTRFGRSAKDLLTNTEELQKLGIIFHSVKDKLDLSTQHGKLFFTILSAIAEFELETIKVRMGDVKMVKWRAGKIALGTAPYGYRWDEDERKYSLIDEEAKIYRRMVREYMKQGKSLLDITLGLQNDHVPPRTKGSWHSSTVGGILRNPFYTGNTIYNVHKRNEKRQIIGEKPVEEHLAITAPELITKHDFDELQKLLDSARKRKSGRPINGAENFWLRDWLVCGVCGGRIVPRFSSGHRYYACFYYFSGLKQREASGHAKCVLPHIRAEWLEDFVSTWFNNTMFSEPHSFAPALENNPTDKRIEQLQERIKNLQRELEGKERGLINLSRMMENPKFDLEGSIQDRNNLLATKRELKAEIKKNEEELAYHVELKANEERFNEFKQSKMGILQDLYKQLSELPNEKKRKLITNSLRELIKVKPPTGEIKPSGDTFLALTGWVTCHFYYNQLIIQEIFNVDNSCNALECAG